MLGLSQMAIQSPGKGIFSHLGPMIGLIVSCRFRVLVRNRGCAMRTRKPCAMGNELALWNRKRGQSLPLTSTCFPALSFFVTHEEVEPQR